MSRLPVPGSDSQVWGQILNDYLDQSHNTDGTVKTAALNTAGAEMVSRKNQPNGYAGLDSGGIVPEVHLPAAPLGISQQTATVYTACDLLADEADLDAFGAYVYANGTAGVGATITGGGNGQLIASGTAATAGKRVAINASNIYGGTSTSGIYVVTTAGSGSAKYVLTRAADANTAATLGAACAVHVGDKTVYFTPQSATFVVGTTAITVAIEYATAHAEGNTIASGQYAHAEGTSTASGDYSHAEGPNGRATGFNAHAECYGVASGYGTHAEGNAVADGVLAHAEQTGHATGNNSHAEGDATASGDYSHAEGHSVAYARDMHSEGIGWSQFSRVTRAGFTLDNTPAILRDSSGSGTLLLPTDFNRAALVTVRVVARQVDVLGTVGSWILRSAIDGDTSGSYRVIPGSGAEWIAGDAAAQSAWSVQEISFDGGSPHILLVTVVGAIGARINWTATIEMDEIV